MEKFFDKAVYNVSWSVRLVATIVLFIPAIVVWSASQAWIDLMDTCDDTL